MYLTKETQVPVINAQLEDNSRVRIVLPLNHEMRLAKTCFRGPSYPCAGNFCAYSTFDELMSDDIIRSALLRDVHEQLVHDNSTVWDPHRSRRKIDYRLQIRHDQLVGWTGATDSVIIDGAPCLLHWPLEGEWIESMLEEHSPQGTWRAMRVRPDRHDVLAPLTHHLTMVYGMHVGPLRTTIFVRTIYPGKDIGQLRGDVTGNKRIVMLDYDHPGEPLR